MKTTITLVLIYIGMAIFTFGHAASHRELNINICYSYIGLINSTDRTEHVFGAFAAGFMWPLYWSWTLQERN